MSVSSKIRQTNVEKLTEELVWLEAWCRVAQASNCVKKSTPTDWADECLKKFKERKLKNIL